MARPDARALPPRAEEALQHCWGCGPANAQGLRLQARTEARAAPGGGGDLTVVDWTPTQAHAGWSTVVHGGLLAAFLDEVAAFAMFGSDPAFGMTSGMQVQYRRRVHWTQPVRGEAWLVERSAGKAVVQARVLQDGHLCTEATVTFALIAPPPPGA
jgi:acyl-coenzyme A thioesterase PaaI-like protein